jgi:hypothetical protein
MISNKKKILAFVLCLFCFLSFGPIVQAANLGDAFKVSDGKNIDPLDTAASKAHYNTSKTDIFPLFSKIINIGLSFLGVIFLLLIIYGGIPWMTDQGNEDQVAKAKKIITTAIIGLVIVIAAYALSWFIMNVLTQNALRSSLTE